jgi:hypothetical protein
MGPNRPAELADKPSSMQESIKHVPPVHTNKYMYLAYPKRPFHAPPKQKHNLRTPNVT